MGGEGEDLDLRVAAARWAPREDSLGGCRSGPRRESLAATEVQILPRLPTQVPKKAADTVFAGFFFSSHAFDALNAMLLITVIG
jgi:hypothetical protein